MIDFTKPVQTVDGRKARILCTDVATNGKPVMGLITHTDKEEYACTWYRDGRINFGPAPSPDDIINSPKTNKVWLNFWWNPNHAFEKSGITVQQHNSKAAADEDVGRRRVAQRFHILIKQEELEYKEPIMEETNVNKRCNCLWPVFPCDPPCPVHPVRCG